MITELVPPGWLLRPQSWPYRMPNTQLGQLTPLALPDDLGKRGKNWQQLFGPNATAAHFPSVRARNAPARLDPAGSSPASAGILGSLTRRLPGDSQPPSSGSPGILGRLGARVVFDKKALLLGCSRCRIGRANRNPRHGTRRRWQPHPRQLPPCRKAAAILLSRKTSPATQHSMRSYPTPIYRN